MVVVALFGATGQTGLHLINLILERKHTIKLLARTPDKLSEELRHNTSVVIVKGDVLAENGEEKVKEVIRNAELVISCAGNLNNVQIMEKLATYIVNCKPRRVLFMTTFGVGGSSWAINLILGMFIGRKNINDYDRADKIIRDADPLYTVVRATELRGDGIGKYRATEKTGVFNSGSAPISREDVALFLADEADKFQNQKMGSYESSKTNERSSQAVQLFKHVDDGACACGKRKKG